jgi:hypothetical protein
MEENIYLINNGMKYYREIQLDNFEIVKKKILYFFIKHYSKQLKKIHGFHFVKNINWLCDMVPELKPAFAKYELEINYLAFYVANVYTIDYVPENEPLKKLYHGAKNPIHVDHYHNQARINIPILNTAGTFTRFFTDCNIITYRNPFSTVPLYLVSNTDYKEVDAVELLTTTVLRVNEPHLVHIPEGIKLPRITLTIGFDKDPVYLLED